MCPRARSGSPATAVFVFLGVLWTATCLPDEVKIPQADSTGTLKLSTAQEHVIGGPILVKAEYVRSTEQAPELFPELNPFQRLENLLGFSCLLSSERDTWFKFGGTGRRDPAFPSPRMHHLDVGGRIERTFDLRQLHIVDHHGIALWEEALRLPGEWTLTCSVFDYLREPSGLSSSPVKIRFVEGPVTDQEVIRIVRESSRYGWFPSVFASDLDPRTLQTVTADTMSLRAAQDIVLLTLWAMESPSSCIKLYETWMKEGRDLGTAVGSCQAIAQACYLEVDKRSTNAQPTDEGILKPAVDLDRLRKTRAGLQAFRSPS